MVMVKKINCSKFFSYHHLSAKVSIFSERKGKIEQFFYRTILYFFYNLFFFYSVHAGEVATAAWFVAED